MPFPHRQDARYCDIWYVPSPLMAVFLTESNGSDWVVYCMNLVDFRVSLVEGLHCFLFFPLLRTIDVPFRPSPARSYLLLGVARERRLHQNRLRRRTETRRDVLAGGRRRIEVQQARAHVAPSNPSTNTA